MQSRTGANGDCFRACIASLLDEELAAVPDFAGEGEHWLADVQAYLRERGLFYLQVEIKDRMLESAFREGQTWHLVEGISPRGGEHACVALNGKLIHDPHPSGHGLAEVETYGFLVSRMTGGE